MVKKAYILGNFGQNSNFCKMTQTGLKKRGTAKHGVSGGLVTILLRFLYISEVFLYGNGYFPHPVNAM